MIDTIWQYTQGEVVLTVPDIRDRGTLIDTVSGRCRTPNDLAHIPLSRVDYAVTRNDLSKVYAEFVVNDMRFYVIDSPEVRQALENTMFENVFKAGDDDDQD